MRTESTTHLRSTHGVTHTTHRRLEDLALGPREAGCSGGASLKRVSVASEALRAIRWRHFPSLEEVALDCPALTHLALADCDSLGDAVRAWTGLSSVWLVWPELT